MSRFNFSFERLNLILRQPFTISRGTKKVVHNVLFKITNGTHSGYGEAAPNARYNEDADAVIHFFKSLSGDFFDEIDTPRELTTKLYQKAVQVQSAKVAVEMAWLDWWGKKQNQPVWKLWEAPGTKGPVTSYTIGLDELEVMQEKVRIASEYPIYKVKLGTDRDRTIIKALREVTKKPLRVDANEGWTTLDEAKRMIDYLSTQNIELIEQPMPASKFEELRQLKIFSPLPICADESFRGDESLNEISEAFDIINIKLMKIGSLVKALAVIKQAREYNLKVMIGCMIESSIAITAGALLSIWADYADLDGHLLIKDDPATGIVLNHDKNIQIAERPGLGFRLQ